MAGCVASCSCGDLLKGDNRSILLRASERCRGKKEVRLFLLKAYRLPLQPSICAVDSRIMPSLLLEKYVSHSFRVLSLQKRVCMYSFWIRALSSCFGFHATTPSRHLGTASLSTPAQWHDRTEATPTETQAHPWASRTALFTVPLVNSTFPA